MDLSVKELNSVFKQTTPFSEKRAVFSLRWRLFKFLSKKLFGLPYDFNPFAPGLEVKYALEEAEKLNAKIVYLGYEIDNATHVRLEHENRNTLVRFIVNCYKLYKNRLYDIEMGEFQSQISQYGVRKYLESSCDQYTMNWMIKVFEKVFPEIKRIMIESREENIFEKLMENKGKVSIKYIVYNFYSIFNISM